MASEYYINIEKLQGVPNYALQGGGLRRGLLERIRLLHCLRLEVSARSRHVDGGNTLAAPISLRLLLLYASWRDGWGGLLLVARTGRS